MTTENKPTAPLSAEDLDKLQGWATDEKAEGYTTMPVKIDVMLALIAQARAAQQAPQASVEDTRERADAKRWRFWRARAGFSSFPEKPMPSLSFQSLKAPSHDMDVTMFGEEFMEEVDRVTDEAMSATQEGK